MVLVRRWLIPGVLLALALAISLQVRRPRWDLPLATSHQFITAHLLTTLKAWDQGGGPAAHRFAPLYTFPNPGDRGVATLGGIGDSVGTRYYVSYPPFAFLAAYGFVKGLGLPLDVGSVLAFNVTLQAISAALLYAFVAWMLRSPGLCWPGLTAATFYLLVPGNLWFHANVCFVDMAAQPLFIGQAFAFAVWMSRSAPGKLLTATLLATTAAFCATEWLGVLATATYGAIALVRGLRGERRSLALALALAGVAALTLALVVWQYASLAGLDALVAALSDKYRERSGHFAGALSRAEAFSRLADAYVANFGAALVWSASATLAGLTLGWKRWTQAELFALALLAGPVLLHHALFFDFTSRHSFSGLKTGFVLFAFAGIAAGHAAASLAERRAALGHAWTAALTVGLGVALLAGFASYDARFPLRAFDPIFRDLGGVVRATAKPDETVCVTGVAAGPELTVYAERNPIGVEAGWDAALAIARERGTALAHYELLPGGRSVRLRRATRDGAVADETVHPLGQR